MFSTPSRFILICGAIALLSFARCPVHAQEIFFSNEPLSTGGQVDAPVFCNGVRIAGADFVAMMYARPAGSSTEYFGVGAPTPFLPAGVISSGNGYWTPRGYRIPGVPNGSLMQVIARVWRVSDGATWEAVRDAGVGWGESAPIDVQAISAGAPPRMVGLQSFDICVPEPRSWVLCVVALAAIGLAKSAYPFRRR